MNPAAPVTSVLTSRPPARRGRRPALLPVGQVDRIASARCRARSTAAAARAGELGGGHRHHAHVERGLAEDLLGELVPGALAAARDVVDAEGLVSDQSHERVGQVRGVGRAADLVAHDDDVALVVPEREHRLHEVLPGGAEEPRAADDEVALVRGRGLGLAGRLRPSVGRQRAGGVGLDVRRALRAVEDVVGRGVHDDRAHLGGAAAPRYRAPSPFTRAAASSSSSAPSTSVYAAQLTTASGRSRANARHTASASRDVEVGGRQPDDVVVQ